MLFQCPVGYVRGLLHLMDADLLAVHMWISITFISPSICIIAELRHSILSDNHRGTDSHIVTINIICGDIISMWSGTED